MRRREEDLPLRGKSFPESKGLEAERMNVEIRPDHADSGYNIKAFGT